VILEANKYIAEVAVSNFSVFVKRVGTWFIVSTNIVLEETQKGKTEFENQGLAKKRINF